MRYTVAQEGVVIPLGRQGENEANTVQFPISGWAEQYGVGEFVLTHKRSGDTDPYLCVTTPSADNDILSWVINSADVAEAGNGCAQLTYFVNDAVAKSVIYSTSVLPSLTSGITPDPQQPWIEQVMQAGASAIANGLKSEGYAVGTQDGVEVESGSPYYENNAKFYAQLSQQGAESSGYVWFDVDEETGNALAYMSNNLAQDITFTVDESTGTMGVTFNG
jgi:hypothetical protein